MSDTATATTTAEKPVDSCLVSTRASLDKYGANIERLNAFIDRYKERLAGCWWSACHIYGHIEIIISDRETSPYERDARAIARRWPGAVWIRTKSPDTCGALDWKTEIAGLPVIIRNAELIKWTPIPNTTVEEEP